MEHIHVSNHIDSFVVVSSNHELNIVGVVLCVVCVGVCVVCWCLLWWGCCVWRLLWWGSCVWRLLWRGSCMWVFTYTLPPPPLSAVLPATFLLVVEVVWALVHLVFR